MSTTTLREHIKRLLLWLMHSPPTPAVMDEVMHVITPEIGDAGVKWRAIRNALKVVGDPWDTALIIAAVIDERVSVQLQRTLEALKLHILLNPEERDIADKVFDKSQLKTLLLTGAGTQADIVSARHTFLNQFMDELTILLFPRRDDLYKIAISMAANVHPGIWLPYKRDAGEANKGADDYFSNGYLSLIENVGHLLPQNYSAFVVKVMSNEIVSSLEPYTKMDFVGV